MFDHVHCALAVQHNLLYARIRPEREHGKVAQGIFYTASSECVAKVSLETPRTDTMIRDSPGVI